MKAEILATLENGDQLHWVLDCVEIEAFLVVCEPSDPTATLGMGAQRQWQILCSMASTSWIMVETLLVIIRTTCYVAWSFAFRSRGHTVRHNRRSQFSHAHKPKCHWPSELAALGVCRLAAVVFS